ncbi:MAG: efflux transporter outer membrane subunit [Rhodoferax sp.]|uniref:efflux transporter outer membrane subunit n=1 Tax=Rhodoferax sp. TaxID=50421 RepID=UPI003264FCAC
MRKSAVLVAALLLAGCASMAPPYATPALPVAGSYGPDTSPDGEQAAATGWRDYFSEPALQGLIAQALANNRDLRTAVLRVDEARAAYGIQRAEAYPSLAAQAGANRSRTPADLSFTGKPLLGSQYQVALGLASWEIDFWGRVRSLQDAALQNYLATDAARQAVTVALVAQVASSYLALRELDERIALAQQTTTSRAESLRIFQRRVAVGSTSRLNLTQVETLFTQAQALGVQLQQARATQMHALTLLVGTPGELTSTAGPTGVALELRAGLPSDLLLLRPDILAAEHQLKASNADIGAARAAFFPRVALTSSWGTASAELDGLFAGGSQAWSFAPSISLPIFDMGRRGNNLALAETRRAIALAQYEKAVQSAFRDVSDALSARRWLTEQTAIAQSALTTQTERARLSQMRYDNGAAAYLDVLDAQRDLLAAQQQLVQTRYALLASRVGLYAALGGGALENTSLPEHGTP